MTRILKPCFSIIAFAIYVSFAHAQTQMPASASGQAAPSLEKLEDIDFPAEPGKSAKLGTSAKAAKPDYKITEQQRKGRDSQFKVETPNTTYYLQRNKQAGTSTSGDTQSTESRPAQWQVMEFDIGKSRERKKSTSEGSIDSATPPVLSSPN